MESVVLQISLVAVLCSLVSASKTNSTSCVTQCGTDCCSDTEICSYNKLFGQRCEQSGKKVICSDGQSYCIEPSTCCGFMSCCPSNTQCCGMSSCCAAGAVCCGMSTCCPAGSTCCGYSTCCSRGSRCVNGYCRAPWSSSMRWYYLIAVLIPFMFVLLYLAKRRQLRLAQQRGQVIAIGNSISRRDGQTAPLSPPLTGYDPPPAMFEPPPYSEIAQIPPDEKPPAYSELYNGFAWQELNNDTSQLTQNNDTSLATLNNGTSQEVQDSVQVEGATGIQTDVVENRTSMEESEAETLPITQISQTQHNSQNTNEGQSI